MYTLIQLFRKLIIYKLVDISFEFNGLLKLDIPKMIDNFCLN